jgi:hypothetical protein
MRTSIPRALRCSRTSSRGNEFELRRAARSLAGQRIRRPFSCAKCARRRAAGRIVHVCHVGHVCRVCHIVLLADSGVSPSSRGAADELRSARDVVEDILRSLPWLNDQGWRRLYLPPMERGAGVGAGGLIERAAVSAERAHAEQRRRSGSARRRHAAEVAGSGFHASTIAGRAACARVADLAILTGPAAGLKWRSRELR